MHVHVSSHASWMVVPFDVSLQLVGIEVNLAQIPGAVPLHLILEVPRLRMSAFPSRRYSPGAHFIAKFHHCNKAVSAGAVPLLVPGYGLAPNAASEPQVEEVNPTGVLGLASSKCWTMSPVKR